MKAYVICDDDCRHEGMTKEQVLTAIEQALENGYISDPDGAIISRLREINKGGAARVWVGTEAEYNALSPAPTAHKLAVRMGADGVLYICTDDSTLADYETHATDKTNPHGVTFKQVMGNDVVPVDKGGTGSKTAKGAEYAIIGAMEQSANTVTDTNQIVFKYTTPNATQGVLLYKTAAQLLEYVTAGIKTAFGFGVGNVLTLKNGGTGATTAKAALKNLGIEIQRGTVDNANSGGTTVTFSEPFSGVPTVIATGGSEVTSVQVRDVTAEGFRLLSGTSNNDGVQWVAIYTAF